MSHRAPTRITPGLVVRGLCAAVVLTRIARGAFRQAPLVAAPDEAGPEPLPSVTVVVPARNEEQRLGPCLAALAADRAIGEVIVVDDESADRTAAVAAAHGARVVPAGHRPEGWTGKAWALQQGIAAASGEWVLTLDADTRVRTGLVAAAVAEARRTQADLLSVGGRFDCASAGERFLHPSMLTTLVYRFGPPGTRRSPRPDRVLANGQCMVLPRSAFLDSGGFNAVAASMTEDVALARHIAGRGGRVRFVDGTGLLDVAGYGSAQGVWTGWGRSLSLAETTSPVSQAADVALLWTTLALPLPRLLLGRGDALDALLLLTRAGTLLAVAGAYRRRGLAWWLSPLADPAIVAQLTATTIRPVRTWRGRTYEDRPGV